MLIEGQNLFLPRTELSLRAALGARDFLSVFIVCKCGAAASLCLWLLFQDESLSFPLGSPSANDIKSIVINARLITLVAMATQLIICTYYYAHANLGAACVLVSTVRENRSDCHTSHTLSCASNSNLNLHPACVHPACNLLCCCFVSNYLRSICKFYSKYFFAL